MVFIAALAGVSPDLHEAATIDGATRFQRIIHINMPAIMPTIIIMLIMTLGGMMNLSFEKVLLMQTDSNTAVSEVISTYVYKLGIQKAQYSLSAAVGLFNNAINLILLVAVNKVSSKISETSLVVKEAPAMVIKETRSDKIFNFFNYLILGCDFCGLPLSALVHHHCIHQRPESCQQRAGVVLAQKCFSRWIQKPAGRRRCPARISEYTHLYSGRHAYQSGCYAARCVCAFPPGIL